jgi:DNA-binding NarL/FixJ family response regulator
MTPRVLIATNEPVLAKGLESVLIAGGLELTDICKDIFEVFDALQRRQPNVAILDMPVLPSSEIVRDLHRVAPQCRLVLWPRASLSQNPAKLLEAINMLAAFSEIDATPSALVHVACSAAERELVTLVGYGLTNEEIAWAMSADTATVQKLVQQVSDKLGAEDRYELAMYGLSTLNDAGKYLRAQEEGI